MPCFHRFQTMPLLRKLTLLFMVLVLVPCLIFGVVLYRQDLNRRIAQAIEQNQSMLRSMSMDIRIRAAQAEIIVEQLTYNASVLQMLSSKTLERQILALLSSVTQQVQNSETYLQHLGADIVLVSGQAPFAEQYSTAVQLNRMLSADAFFQAFWADAGRSTAWGLPGKLLPGTVDSTGQAGQVLIPYYRKIVQGLSRTKGAIKCGVLPQSLFASLTTRGDARTVLVRRGPDILYQTGERMAFAPDMGGDAPLVRDGLLYLSLPLEDMDYELLLALDYRFIHRQSLMASLPAMLSGPIAGGLLMLATRLLLLSLLGRLEHTLHAIGFVRAGETRVQLPGGGPDEVGQLIDAFNRLLAKIDANKEELLRKEQDKQQARLMALQYQVNPHFLFNALYWLQMKVEEEGLSAQTSNAIASLGGVLHYNLSETSHATLEQEAAHMRAYIQFMRIRHAQNIALALEWPEALQAVEILRFTFQPILENAIHHGLIPGRDLHIRVSVTPDPEAGMLRAVASNDGQPMDAAQRRQVRELLVRAVRMESPQEHGSIGLYNLTQRLRLYYGFRASLTLLADDRTTSFIIEMPYDLCLARQNLERPPVPAPKGASNGEFSDRG